MPNIHQNRRIVLANPPRNSIPPLPAGETARWNELASAGADGDLIASISDLIGSNTATAAGSARGTLKTGANGLNGRPVVLLDGVANAYNLGSTIATSGDFTIIAVWKRTGATMVSLGATGDFYPSFLRTDILMRGGNGRGGAGGGYSTASNADSGQWQIASLSWSGNAAVGGRVNGSALSYGATTNYGAGVLFNAIGKASSVFGSGYLADLLVYSGTALSDAQLQAAHANLNSTWGGVY